MNKPKRRKRNISSSREFNEEIKNIILDISGISISTIKNSTNLLEDLGIDSFSATEILVAVEQKYGIVIKKTEAFNVRTFKDVLNLVQKYLLRK